MCSQSSARIEISLETMDRLKKIAQPFTDTPDSVISRLIEYYEGTQNIIEEASSDKNFKAKNGTKIPLGDIYGNYKPRGSKKPHLIRGTVTEKGIEVDGELFDDPSSAAKHAKKNLGAGDSAASTNGWDFWRIVDKHSNKNKKLDDLRKAQKHANLTLEDLGL